MSKKLDIDDYILANYKTKTNREMAEECDCNVSTIRNHRKKMGISTTNLDKNLRSPEIIKYICDNYGKNTSHNIAKQLNCSYQYVKKIWRENNLGVGQQNRNTYLYNTEYFSQISSLEQAYWLGFIVADGCIYRRDGHQGMISIQVKEDDIEICENFNKALNSTKPISRVKGMVSLQITGDQICDDLLFLGVGVRKTWDMKFEEIFSHLPDNLTWGFLLGYFDGDGCISHRTNGSWKMGYVGPSGNMEFLSQWLQNHLIDARSYQDNRDKYRNDFSELLASNITARYCLAKIFLSLNIPSLDRKKVLMEEMCLSIENNSTNRSENVDAVDFYESVVHNKWGELRER